MYILYMYNSQQFFGEYEFFINENKIKLKGKINKNDINTFFHTTQNLMHLAHSKNQKQKTEKTTNWENSFYNLN